MINIREMVEIKMSLKIDKTGSCEKGEYAKQLSGIGFN